MNFMDDFFKQYIDKFNDSKYVGVEIEMPIVNLSCPSTIEKMVIANLFSKLKELNFEDLSYDDDKNVIAVKNDIGDTISLEYSYNTIELSLNKELSIYKLQEKFIKYYDFMSKILKQYNYKIVDNGINPNYKLINRNCLNHPRYKVIERLLTGNNPDLLNQFCSYCCSVQTHVNCSKDKIINIINMLTLIENNKNDLFANSFMSETNLKNSRKILWENSNFGSLNIGKNKIYSSLNDLINNYEERYLFYIKRNDKYLLLNKKMSIKNYFENIKNVATDKYGKLYEITPNVDDLECFRSYKSVEITKYGTLEIRTDCTQKIDNIFKLVAFNVGICTNFIKVLDYAENNKLISCKKLIELSIQGLKLRNEKEEKLLEVCSEKNWNMDV